MFVSPSGQEDQQAQGTAGPRAFLELQKGPCHLLPVLTSVDWALTFLPLEEALCWAPGPVFSPTGPA